MRFRLFGFPIHVHWTFLLLSALLAYGRNDTTALFMWIAVVFASVLIHELGHAAMGRSFGLSPSIQLYSMGGLTSWSGGRRLAPRQSLLVSLAGPAAGFVVGGAVYLLRDMFPLSESFYARVLYYDLLWVNFGWGILNLLPILPLDGGQALRSFLQIVRGVDDLKTVQKISVVVGGGLAVLALSRGMLWGAMVAGMITWSNVTALRGPRASQL